MPQDNARLLPAFAGDLGKHKGKKCCVASIVVNICLLPFLCGLGLEAPSLISRIAESQGAWPGWGFWLWAQLESKSRHEWKLHRRSREPGRWVGIIHSVTANKSRGQLLLQRIIY
jgi:hypothetical protein